jgi:hypothetical protein
MTLSLAFLDPALIKAAAQGRLPRGYGVSRLIDLPPRFEDQWRALGLARPTGISSRLFGDAVTNLGESEILRLRRDSA